MINLITIPVNANNFTPVAGQTLYFSNLPDVPIITYYDYRAIYMPYEYIIRGVNVFCHNDQAPAIPQPTTENWPLAILVNGITVINVGNQINISPTEKNWANNSINYKRLGGYLTLRLINPAWVTVPNNCKLSGFISLELI